MSEIEQLSTWIINNQDKKGSYDFNVVANALKELTTGQPQINPDRQGALGYSVDQAQKMAGKGIEVIGDLTGFEGMKDWGKSIVAQQDKDIAEGGYVPHHKGSLRDAWNEGGLGNAMSWIGEKTAENAASAGFALGGGVVAAGTALVSVPLATVVGLGTLAGSALMGTGETALSMEDKTGEYDSAMAAGAGAIIGVLDKFGAGKVIPKSQLANMSAQQIINALQSAGRNDAASAIFQFFTRNAKKAGFEGVTEAGQQGTSIGATALSGGEYTGQEVADELIDAAAIGTSMGGGVGVAGDTASGIAKGTKKAIGATTDFFNPDGTPVDPEAASELATRLKEIADRNGYDLQDLDKTSTEGARETVDKAHVQMAEEIKQLVKDLKKELQIDATQKDELDTVVKKVLAMAGGREARNKTKNTVGVQELEAIEQLAGGTLEGQKMLSLMRQMNELTKLHNSGYQGGVSKYTDLLSPLGSNIGYDRGAIATERLLRPLATGGLALQTGGTSLLGQTALFGAGRLIDRITGARSNVQNFIDANIGGQGITPSGVSVRQQAIDAEKKQKDQERREAARTARTEAARRRLNRQLYDEGADPHPDSPQGVLETATGLDRQTTEDILEEILQSKPVNSALRKAINDYKKSIREGGKVEGLTELIRKINSIVSKRDDLKAKRKFDPKDPKDPNNPNNPNPTGTRQGQGQQQTPDPLEGLTGNQRRGANANIKFIQDTLIQLQEDFTNGVYDPNNPTHVADAEAIIEALENLATNLGQDPINAAQAIYSNALAKLNDKQMAVRFLAPYMDRIAQQQNAQNKGNKSIDLRDPKEPPKKRKLEEIGDILEEKQMQKYGRKLDPEVQEDFDLIVKDLTEEADFEDKRDNKIREWYAKDIADAMEETAKYMPELTDPNLSALELANNRKLLLLLVAITSIGDKPIMNWRQGGSLALNYFENVKKGSNMPQFIEEKLFDVMKKGKFQWEKVKNEDGKIVRRKIQESRIVNPATGNKLGGKARSKEPALRLLQHLIDTRGLAGTMRLLHSQMTVKEINAIRAEVTNPLTGKPLGKQAKLQGGMNAVYPAVYMFGQKVAPFYHNLNGIDDITVDLWASRNIGRITGNLKNPNFGKKGMKDETPLIDTPTPKQLPTWKRIYFEVGKNLGYKGMTAQALLWKYEQALYNDLGGTFDHEYFSQGAKQFTEKDISGYDKRKGLVAPRIVRSRSPNQFQGKPKKSIDDLGIGDGSGRPARIEPALITPNIYSGIAKRLTEIMPDMAKADAAELVNKALINQPLEIREKAKAINLGLKDGKPLSIEDINRLREAMAVTFEFLLPQNDGTMGEAFPPQRIFDELEGQFIESGGNIKVVRLDDPKWNSSRQDMSKEEAFVKVFIHEVFHTLENNIGLRQKWRDKFRSMLDSTSGDVFIDRTFDFEDNYDTKTFAIINEMISASIAYRPHRWKVIEENIAALELANRNMAFIDPETGEPFDFGWREFQLDSGETIFLPPEYRTKDGQFLQQQKRDQFYRIVMNTNLDKDMKQETLNRYKTVLELMNYHLDPAELLADSFAVMVTQNMEGKNTKFKNENPRLYKELQKAVADSDFRHMLVLNSLFGIIGAAGIQAMLQSLSGEDEEGILNLGQGILAA
tara:strand:+ start:7349 stop:12235 length:4887 start_codon:yes stop_codon:yes gene_type:complete